MTRYLRNQKRGAFVLGVATTGALYLFAKVRATRHGSTSRLFRNWHPRPRVLRVCARDPRAAAHLTPRPASLTAPQKELVNATAAVSQELPGKTIDLPAYVRDGFGGLPGRLDARRGLPDRVEPNKVGRR